LQGELYGITIEHVRFNQELEFGLGEVETVIVDPLYFGVYPVNLKSPREIQKADALFYFYPMSVREIKRRWPETGKKVKPDSEFNNLIEDERREVGGGAHDTEKKMFGAFITLSNSVKQLLSFKFANEDDEEVALVCECWTKDYTMVDYEDPQDKNEEILSIIKPKLSEENVTLDQNVNNTKETLTDEELKVVKYVVDLFEDAKVIGSLLKVKPYKYLSLRKKLVTNVVKHNQTDIFTSATKSRWYEVFWIVNSSKSTIYVNGVYNFSYDLVNYGGGTTSDLRLFNDAAGNQDANDLSIDELGIWCNRGFTTSEILSFWNDGDGITPPESAPEISITITNPTATTYTTDTHDLEYTYDEGDGTADSCWYSLDLGQTNSSRVDCGINWTSLSASEGSNTWTVYGNTTDGTLSNDIVTFSVDTIDPVVNVEYPTGTIDYTSPGTTLELNFTATDTNLDSCWYEYDDSNTTVSCSSGVKVNTNFTLTDQSNLTVWANDSVGRLASNFTSWEANLQVNNLTYTGNVFETSRQTFTAEFEVLDTEISSLQFLYNNETYTITGYTFDGNILTLTKTIDIPLNTNPFSNQTSNFSFKFDYGGGSIQNTEKFYQNVSYINLQNCNTTTTTQALNFTLYDELKQQNINAAQNSTSFESFFSYWIGSGDIKKTYAFQELLNSSDNSYQFCIYPYNQNTTFKVDSDIDYSATYFRENQHHLRNSTLTNVSNDILLYLISNDEATKFFLTFQQGVNFIDDATVTVQKYFTGLGEYKSVAILLTDDDGETTMWQEVDKQYKYSVVQDGSLLGVVERTSICSVAPCTMTIALESASENVFEPYYDVYAIGITSNLSFDKDSKIVTYNFLDTTGLANYFRLVVKEMQMNSTGNTICDSQLYSIAGTLTCNLSAYSNSEFIATTYISRSPELTDKVLGIIISEDIIEGLGLMGIFLIMGIIITIVFAGAVVTKGSPSGVLWFLAIGILVLKLMGLFPFTWITTTALMIIILYIISKVKT